LASAALAEPAWPSVASHSSSAMGQRRHQQQALLADVAMLTRQRLHAAFDVFGELL
jgi:hypothetical protein